MHKTGGREARHSRIEKGVLCLSVLEHFSSSTLDRTDPRIVSIARGRPMTTPGLAEEVDINFVKSMLRARRLYNLELPNRTNDLAVSGDFNIHSSNGGFFLCRDSRRIPRQR